MHGSGLDFGIQTRCYLGETKGCLIRGSVNKPWKLEWEKQCNNIRSGNKASDAKFQAEEPGVWTYFFLT